MYIVEINVSDQLRCCAASLSLPGEKAAPGRLPTTAEACSAAAVPVLQHGSGILPLSVDRHE